MRDTSIAARVMWVLSLMLSIFGALSGFVSIQTANSARQQKAAAAMGCFYIIAPYVFARAFERIVTR